MFLFFSLFLSFFSRRNAAVVFLSPVVVVASSSLVLLSVASLLVSDRDEVLAELLRHRGGLLGHHGLLVTAHDEGLRRLDGVHARGALLGPHHLVCRGEVHVARAGDGHAALGELVRAAVLGQQGLQLIHGDLGKENFETNLDGDFS